MKIQIGWSKERRHFATGSPFGARECVNSEMNQRLYLPYLPSQLSLVWNNFSDRGMTATRCNGYSKQLSRLNHNNPRATLSRYYMLNIQRNAKQPNRYRQYTPSGKFEPRPIWLTFAF
jgi:hypothetical protein